MTKSEVHGLEVIQNRLSELYEIIPKFQVECASEIYKSAELMIDVFSKKGKVLVCGNGGSAADSQHFAAEFVSSFSKGKTRKALPVMALTVDTSILTAYSNDFNFDEVFSRQIEAYGTPGDILIVFTTSGSSLNCLNAARKAIDMGLKVISFTKRNGEISKVSDITIGVPSSNTQHIQECHMISYHIIAEIVENSVLKSAV